MRSSGKAGGGRFQTAFQATQGRNTPPWLARRLWAHAGVGFVEREECLATTGRGHRRWDRRQLAMTQEVRAHRLLEEGGHDPQRATAAPGKVARPGATASAQRVARSLRPPRGGRHGARARGNTRPRSLGQCQDGVPVFDAAPSTPCWRGVGVIAARACCAALGSRHSMRRRPVSTSSSRLRLTICTTNRSTGRR